MIKNTEEIATELKETINKVKDKVKNKELITEAEKEIRIKKEFNILKETLVKISQEINAKDEKDLTASDLKTLTTINNLTNYSDDYCIRLRETIRLAAVDVIRTRSENLTNAYYNTIAEFENKIAIPTIFNKEFFDNGLFFLYDCSDYYNIFTSFETTIKRYKTRNGLLQLLPIDLQIKIKGYIIAYVGPRLSINSFSLVDNKFLGIKSFHSDSSICLGELGAGNFIYDFTEALKVADWKQIKLLFKKIEKQFENINFGGAYHHNSFFREEASINNIYKKHLKLGIFLDGKLEEHHYTDGEDDDRDEEYEPEPEEDYEEH